jgi:hypothetical protein
MDISLNLNPDIERGLLAKAQSKGISLFEFVEEIVTREARNFEKSSDRTGQELLDIGARVRGLLSDDEVDSLLARNSLLSPTVDLS